MATKNVAEGRMAKEFRQNRRAAGGKELERKVTAGIERERAGVALMLWY